MSFVTNRDYLNATVQVMCLRNTRGPPQSRAISHKVCSCNPGGLFVRGDLGWVVSDGDGLYP